MWWYIAAAVAVLAMGGISFYAYRIAFYSPKKDRERYGAVNVGQYAPLYQTMSGLIQRLASLPFESITVTSFDGLKLHARYYHIADGAPLQIQVHGYRGHAYRDLCGGHRLAQELGHNVLLIDQRAMGKSQGRNITFGQKEARDCLTWLSYANRRWGEDVPVYLVGVSMGASTVLTATRYDLPDNVRGVIADCPFSSAKEIICKVAKDRGYPTGLMYPFLLLGAWCFGGIVLHKADRPVEVVKHTRCPVLLIHGEEDRFVPCDMSRAIYDACGSEHKQLFIVPGAAHGVSCLVDEVGYKQQVADFIAKTL